MSYWKNPLLLVSILLVAVGVVYISAWLNTAESISYADLKTALAITTETFGIILGIITGGLMFTQGKFSELSSELNEKLPEYLTNILSLKKMQAIEAHLLTLRKTFNSLAVGTTIVKEKDLYERIVEKASSLSANFAVLSHLKLKQQGLIDTRFLVSEMDSNLYEIYERRKQNIKREWQLLRIIKQTVDIWEAPATSFIEKPNRKSALQADLKSSISILKLKENVDRGSRNIRSEVTKTLDDLRSEISEISKRLDKDRIPKLLSQMEQASTIRGKYFYLTLIFIAAPLLINLLILPQLSEATATFFKPIILITSLLSIMGVMFLFLYIHKILNV